MTSLSWLLVLALSAPSQGFAYPPQVRGATRAELTVHVAERGPVPGKARVELTLNVTGPASLDIDQVRLEDAQAAWKIHRAASAWYQTDNVEHVGWWAQIDQVKPGVVPLPALRVRVRDGTSADEFTWTDLLRPLRGSLAPEPVPAPPPPAWHTYLYPAGWVMGGLAVLVLGLAALRRRHRPAVPLLPHQSALAVLDSTPPPPATEVRSYHAVLADILRVYLRDRFEIPAPHLTTPDVLAAVAAHPGIDPARRELLRQVLERCDQVKFAGVSLSAEETQESAQLVRQFIQATAAATGEAGQSAQSAPIR
jgi:hypothetical protein